MAETKQRVPIIHKLQIPEGVTIVVEGNAVTVKGDKGEASRRLADPLITIKQAEGNLVLQSKENTKKNKRVVNTFKAHMLNLFTGVTAGFTYKLKVCSGHFPMTVKQEGEKIVISNFLGEKVPRVARIMPNTQVKIEKETITVEATNIEDAGQTAANLERATKIKNRDRRVFQDGIYITQKPERISA